MSDNFTVAKYLLKPFIFNGIWENTACKDGAVSENFTISPFFITGYFLVYFVYFSGFLLLKCQSFLQSRALEENFFDRAIPDKLWGNCFETINFHLFLHQKAHTKNYQGCIFR